MKVKFHVNIIKEHLDFILNCVIILLISLLFDKFFAMLLFILFLGSIKSCFKIEFHADSLFENEPIKAVKYCRLISIGVELLYLFVSSNIVLSLYINIFLIFALTLVNSLLELSLETIIIKNSMPRRQQILEIVANDEDQIEMICRNNCLNGYSEIIYLYLNNTIEETSEILNIPVRTINNKINKFIRTFK